MRDLEVGDSVYVNGFRLKGTINGEHHYGTNEHMEYWEQERTPLLVRENQGDAIHAEGEKKNGGTDYFVFHPLELSRY